MNIPDYRSTRVRVFVDRPGAEIEITDRLRSGRVTLGDVTAVGSSHAGVDATVTTLNLVLDHGAPSLAPGATSSLNEPDELLRPYRPIRVVTEDEDGSITLFSGYLGDEIRSSAAAGRASITLTARDLAKPLQDLFLPEFPILAADATDVNPVPVDDVLTELLALVPAHLRPPLVVTDPVNLSVREPYRPQNCSVWDAMQQLAIQSGWYLGVVGDNLVFMDPPRDKVTPDITLDTDDAFTDDLGISDTDVRNVVRVAFIDSDTREREVIEQRDQWSIDNITGGIEKTSVIELDATSQIDTLGEAQALATRFISDMSREFASTQLNLPFLPSLWLFSVIQMTHEKFTSLPRVFAVHSVHHTFDQTRRRTIVAGVGQVVGKRRAWLHLEPRPGSPNDPRGPHQSVLPAPIVSVTHGNPGIIVNIDQRRGVDARSVEIHMSTTPGFIPSPGSLVAEGEQEKWAFTSTNVADAAYFIPGVTHHIRVRSVDSQGNPGRFTQQLSITPARIDPSLITLDGNVRVNGDLAIYGANGNTGTLVIRRGGNDVLRVGDIEGMPGVPSNVDEGFWGALGTGIFIQGVTELISRSNPGMNVQAGVDLVSGQRDTVASAWSSAINIIPAVELMAGQMLVGVVIPGPLFRAGSPLTHVDSFVPSVSLQFRNSSGTWLTNSEVGPQTINAYRWSAAGAFVARVNATGVTIGLNADVLIFRNT